LDNSETNLLKHIELAPYLQLATALIGKSRRIGGNQFRHVWATVGILIDYKIIDSATLKAAALHDLKEDVPYVYSPERINNLDEDGPKVVKIIEELSIRDNEPKSDYLLRVMLSGSNEAKLIKLADRISNLTDIQLGIFDIEKLKKILDETKEYILPYAKAINYNMYLEINDFINSRSIYAHKTVELIVKKALKNIIKRTQDFNVDIQELITNHSENIIKDIEDTLHLPDTERPIYAFNISRSIEPLELFN